MNGVDRSVATLAAWFHDAVYDRRPGGDNEAKQRRRSPRASWSGSGRPRARAAGRRRRARHGIPRPQAAGVGRPGASRRARRRPLGAVRAGGPLRRVLRAGARGVRAGAGGALRDRPLGGAASVPRARPRVPHDARPSPSGSRPRARTSRASSPASRAEHRDGERPPELVRQTGSNSSQVVQRRSDVSSSSATQGGRRPWTAHLVDLEQVAPLAPQPTGGAVVEALVAAGHELAARPRGPSPRGSRGRRSRAPTPRAPASRRATPTHLGGSSRRRRGRRCRPARRPSPRRRGRRGPRGRTGSGRRRPRCRRRTGCRTPAPPPCRRAASASGARSPGAPGAGHGRTSVGRRRRRRTRTAPRARRSGHPRNHGRGCRSRARSGAARRGWCR